MNAIIPTTPNLSAVADLSQAMADFLRLNVADRDASPKMIASYLTEVRQYTLMVSTGRNQPDPRHRR